MSECLVSERDYREHFKAEAQPIVSVRPYDGPERRMGGDRRREGHERRWEASRGRRFTLGDRRHAR